ncbi:MAG: hypothetical protein JWR10_1395 [Rubritepida sp.]|nr:hypothetical protein [Rubritepida sp.]
MPARNMAEMVREQETLTLPVGATVLEACIALHERKSGAALIVDDGKLVGIFTARDAVHALARGLDPPRTLISQAMTADPCCLGAQGEPMDALRLMQDGGFRHLPVVEDGKLLGMVQRHDFHALEHRRMDDETDLFETIR